MADTFVSALQGCVRLHSRSAAENLNLVAASASASTQTAATAAASRAQLDCIGAVLAVRGDTREEFLVRADQHLANLQKVCCAHSLKRPT